MTVLTLFLILALMTVGWLWMDVGRASIATLKAQTGLDVVLLSSLRIRAESLHTIAVRWEEFGSLFGPVFFERSVSLRSSDWAKVEKKAADLKKALLSYEGRTTAIIKVVGDANKVRRDEIDIQNSAGSRLGLVAEPLNIKDENGFQKTISGGWVRRLWVTDDPGLETLYALVDSVPVHSGANWKFIRKSSGQVVWDVSRDDASVKLVGNGGYPENWSEAIRGERLDPHRYPFYRARLKGGME